MNKLLLLTVFLLGIGSAYVGVTVFQSVKGNIQEINKSLHKTHDCAELAKEAFLCRIDMHNKSKE